MDEKFDLFGVPIPDGHGKRGRPAHIATSENINRVKMLLAFGWSNERIATAMKISQPTLRKNYFQVLEQRSAARDQMEAARALKLWDLAMAGNVGAFKELSRVIETNDAMVAARAYRGDDDEEPKPEKIGKKEQAQRDAEQAEQSDTWGDDLKFRGRVN